MVAHLINLKTHITALTSRIKPLYRDHKQVADRLMIIAAAALAAALPVLIAGLFVDDVILRLRDGMFALVLAGVKLTLTTLGYELVEHNIRGVLQLEGGHLLVVDHHRLHIRYYMLSIIVSWISFKDIKKAAIAAVSAVPVLYIISIICMSLVVLNAKEVNQAVTFSINLKYTVLILLFIIVNCECSKILLRLGIIKIIKKTTLKNSKGKAYLGDYISNMLILHSFVQITLMYLLGGVLIEVIMFNSNWILKAMGYSPILNTPYLKGDNAWIFIAQPCLGIQISTIFIVVLFLFKGKIRYKLIFSLLGLGIISFLNSIRIVVLYIYISRNNGVLKNEFNRHDVFNYPVYLVIVLLWLLFLKYFSKSAEAVKDEKEKIAL